LVTILCTCLVSYVGHYFMFLSCVIRWSHSRCSHDTCCTQTQTNGSGDGQWLYCNWEQLQYEV